MKVIGDIFWGFVLLWIVTILMTAAAFSESAWFLLAYVSFGLLVSGSWKMAALAGAAALALSGVVV